MMSTTDLVTKAIHHPDGADHHRDFIVGQDQDGHWLAVETHGLGGGFFANQNAAIRYAAFETGSRCDSIRIVKETLRLRP